MLRPFVQIVTSGRVIPSSLHKLYASSPKMIRFPRLYESSNAR